MVTVPGEGQATRYRSREQTRRRPVLDHLTLRGRLVLAIGLPIVLLVAVAVVVVEQLQVGTLEEALRAHGRAILAVATASVGPTLASGDPAALQRLVADVARAPSGADYLIVLDPGGRVLASNRDGEVGRALNDLLTLRAIRSEEVVMQAAVQGGAEYLDVAGPVLAGGQRVATVRVGIPTGLVTEQLAAARRLSVLIVVLAAMLGGLCAYVVSRLVAAPIVEVTRLIAHAADGDFGQEAPARTEDELGNLARSYNRFMVELRRLVAELADAIERTEAVAEELSVATDEVKTSTAEVSSAIEQIAFGAQSQAGQVDRTARAVEQMSASTREIDANARTVREASVRAGQIVDSSTQAVRSLIEKSQEIGKVVGLNMKFADQTNLLAINAAIEAARAGEHGRTFAVVADEIRRLADSSSRSVEEIAALNAEIQQVASRVLPAMEEVTDSVARTLSLAEEAARAADRQRGLAEEIVRTVRELAGIAEQNAAATVDVSSSTQEQMAAFQEISLSAQDLADMAGRLRSLVDRYGIQPPAGTAADQLDRRAH